MKKLLIVVVVFVFLFVGIATAGDGLVKIYYNTNLESIWVMQGNETLLRVKLNEEQALALYHIKDGAYEAQIFENGAIDIINLVDNNRAGFVYLAPEQIKAFVGKAAVFVVF